MKMGMRPQPRRDFEQTDHHDLHFDLLGLNGTKSCLKFEKIFLRSPPASAPSNSAVALNRPESCSIVLKKIIFCSLGNALIVRRVKIPNRSEARRKPLAKWGNRQQLMHDVFIEGIARSFVSIIADKKYEVLHLRCVGDHLHTGCPRCGNKLFNADAAAGTPVFDQLHGSLGESGTGFLPLRRWHVAEK